MNFPQVTAGLLLLIAVTFPADAQQAWTFVVSGDSRNCGDVVMPAIAKSAQAANAAFYWHLGDYRAIYRFDQDYWQLHKPAEPSAANIAEYQAKAWQDFMDNQIKAFGAIPVFLALGNHETIPPKTRDQALLTFADWFDQPIIRDQRIADNAGDHTVRGYYHWKKDGIDFITLDNATGDQFDTAQTQWIRRVLDADGADSSVRAIVIGMHEALPDSISASHSMNQSLVSQQSGETVYRWLLDWRTKFGRPMYVLASHSHFYMEGIFNTEYWRSHGGVLPGWIVGTAGAERYPLPQNAKDAKQAKTMVYGYLVGTVSNAKADPIQFRFVELSESDVPASTAQAFSPDFVHGCWVGNPDTPVH